MKQELFISYWKKWKLSFLISACCFLYLLSYTWLKWGDLIVDLGREAYVPLELASGKLLYRDIFYLYGPFSPYFNAFLFKIFSPSITTLVLSGLITIILCSVLIYKICRLFLEALEAALAVITFLFVFAFSNYYYAGIFNFILPYSYSSVHGILFSLCAFYFFCKWFKRKTWIYTWMCSLSLTVALLCKIEVALAVSLALIIAMCLYVFKMKNSIFQTVAIIITPVFLAAFVYGVFFILSKDAIQKSNLYSILCSNLGANNIFSKNIFMEQSILKSIGIICRVFLYYLFMCGSFILGGFILEKYIYNIKQDLIKKISIVCVYAVFLSGVYLFISTSFPYNLQYRILPLISFYMAIVFLWRFIKNKGNIPYFFIGTLCLASFFMMSRVFFNAWAGHYGFYLLVIPSIAYYVFFLKLVPDFFKSSVIKNFYKICFIFISVLFIMNHFAVSGFLYNKKTLRIVSERGSIYALNDNKDYRLREFIEFLSKHTKENETLAVFPEGIFINFLSKRKNPLYYYQYLPLDLEQGSIEADIIKDIEDKKIDYIAIAPRPVEEYGYKAFGYDYGLKIYNYITDKYELYKQFGQLYSISREYSIVLFKRKT